MKSSSALMMSSISYHLLTFPVTYGCGRFTRSRTLDIVQALCARGETDIAPHMSCIGDDKSQIAELLDLYKGLGIQRLVALRGDLPSGQVGMGELPFALDLVKFIREYSGASLSYRGRSLP